MERRAQVTIFVLIGVLLVLAVTGAIYLVQDTTESTQNGNTGEADQQTSYEDAVPGIAQWVRSCAEDVTLERLRELSNHGGFTEQEAENMRFRAEQAHRNTALDVYGDGDSIIPYWEHSPSDISCTECERVIRVPPLTSTGSVDKRSIQDKVEQYANREIKECANDFRQFNNTYDVTQTSDPDVSVLFNEEDTTVQVDWGLRVTEFGSDTTFNVNRFETTIDLPYKDLYEASISSAEALTSDRVPEDYGLSIISALSLDETIPPLAGGRKLGKRFDVWLHQDVEETLRQSLSSYVNLISVIGPDQKKPTFPNVQLETLAKDTWAVANEPEVDRIGVQPIIRPQWPIDLRVNNDDSVMIQPRSYGVNLKFLNLGITNYDFTYDLVFPVAFRIEDSDALNGEGFDFTFALESNIRQGAPLKETREAAESADTNTEEGVSLSGLGAPVNVTIDGPQSQTGYVELRCGPETLQGSDQDSSTEVIETRLPTCTRGELSYKSNLIQSEDKTITISDQTSNDFTLETFEPHEVTVNLTRKLVYDKNKDPEAIADGVKDVVDIEEDFSADVSSSGGLLPFEPAVSIGDVDVGIISGGFASLRDQIFSGPDFHKPNYVAANITIPRYQEENTSVIFKQIDGDWVQTAQITGNNTSASLQLFPGKYNVMVFSREQLEEPFETEAKEVCGTCVGVDCQCQTIPSQQINDSLLLGYYGTNKENVSSVNIKQNTGELNLPYFSNQPDQIKYTRDMMITASLFQMPVKYNQSITPTPIPR